MQNQQDYSASSIVSSEIGNWIIKTDDHSILSIDYSKEPNSPKKEENNISKEAKKQLEEYFKNERHEFDLPLNMNGHTDFYKSVWQALLKIEYGKTRSYTDLSVAINNPKAVRAVGMANGKNPFAIVVPCHRVIGKDNSLTGYASGIDVKRWLLEHEGILAKQTSLF